MSRCTGHCCRGFPLPIAPEQLEAGIRTGSCCLSDRMSESSPLGIQRWGPWLRYLGKLRAHPYADRGSAVDHPDCELHYYSCLKLGEDGSCTVYDQRPHFCRSYGVEVACEYSACTWHEAVTPETQREANEQALKEIREYLSEKKEELTAEQRQQLREGCSREQLESLAEVLDD